jgi:membrane protease YdiL (CAAX protease family)
MGNPYIVPVLMLAMKKVVGILVLLVFSLVAGSGSGSGSDNSPDYEFKLVWKNPTFSVSDYEDLDGDGLSEILCYNYQDLEESGGEQNTIALLDIYSNVLWQFKVDGFLSSSQFEDIDGDGIKEIFLDIQLFSSRGICPEIQKYFIICVNAEGTILWSKILEEWVLQFGDVNGDGVKEILVGNVILDKNGDVLHEYNDYSIVGYIEDPFRIILVKHSNTGKKDYTSYRIVTVQGDIVWEKEFSESTSLEIEEVDTEKRVFLLQKWRITELNMHTYEEVPCTTFDQPISVYSRMGTGDMDGDGSIEYVIISDESKTGRSKLYVFNDNFNVLWKYSNPAYYIIIKDIDSNKKYEFLLYYKSHSEGGRPVSGFFRVLNYDTSERWTIFLESVALLPWPIDIEGDGDTEFLFTIDVSGEWYVYIFGPDGEIETQIKVPNSVMFYTDLDGDIDIDILCYGEDFEELHLYTNTKFQGELDKFSGFETLEKVNMGEKGIKRNFWSPSFYYGYKRVIYIIEHPERGSDYSWRVSVFLSVLVGLGVGIAFFVVKKLEERDEWEVLWDFKKVFYYLGFLIVAPVGVLYFVYTIRKLGDTYRKALGIVKPPKKYILYSVVVGMIFFFVLKTAEVVLSIHGVPYVDIDIYKGGLICFESIIFILGMAMIVTLPFIEEILFSGYFYPVAREKMGIKLGIAVTALIFTVFHLVFVFLDLQTGLIPLFYVFSGIKMYSYERTHCIFVPMVMYAVYYFAILVVTFI